jgi:outer membrane lipoprotein SlyB
MNSLTGSTGANWPLWKKAIVIGGTLLFLCVLWWLYIAHAIYDKLNVWLTLMIPVDPIITNLISDLLASTFYFAFLPGFVSRILFRVSKQILWGAFVLVLVSVTVVDLTLGRDVFFGKDGQPRRFFVIRPDEGLVVTGSQTTDPTTGEMPRPISREIVPSIRAMYRGQAPNALKPTDIDEKRLFDPSTGRSLIWYHKDANGTLKLYDGPGFDPESQEPLRPMIKELVPLVKSYIKNEKAAFSERKRQEEIAALAEQNRLAAQEAEQAAIREKQALDAQNKADLEVAKQQYLSGNLMAASQYVNTVLARDPGNILANEYNTSWRLGNVCNNCGTIVRVWDETVASDGAAVNTMIGGAAGYVAGRQVGKGQERDVASALVGIAGALIGKSLSRKTVRHVDIQMDNGNSVSYLLGLDSNFAPGQRVRVTANSQQVSITILQ